MPGIGTLDVEGFRDRIHGFEESYVRDRQSWVCVLKSQRDVAHHANHLGRILRRWQACRPNRMRRAESEAKHKRPYLEDLIEEGQASVQALVDFNMRLLASFTLQAQQALESLWHTFQKLPYAGTARNGLAGVVGISKAVLLLTEGRVGPAFDSEVRRNLGICRPEVARDWIKALQVASKDIRGFEDAIQCTLQEAAPTRFADLHTGRIYDMVLGPRNAMNNR